MGDKFNKAYLSAVKAVKRLRTREKKLGPYAKNGTLPHKKVGSLDIIARAALDRWWGGNESDDATKDRQ